MYAMSVYMSCMHINANGLNVSQPVGEYAYIYVCMYVYTFICSLPLVEILTMCVATGHRVTREVRCGVCVGVCICKVVMDVQPRVVERLYKP